MKIRDWLIYPRSPFSYLPSTFKLRFGDFRTTSALAMRILSLALPLAFAATAWASALTTSIAANERQCYYVDVDKAGEKIGVRSFMSVIPRR
jgi:hypothetical protein